ncbi:MAG: KEOPS complex N(6)-L-threonylcarbamoyladenine synthase Kae1 [Candidatus Aenigmarchaeota archaeon]|nr:KEOPS complex N(6)-L-threonylcarbamoyladenine synthase Kae1 [Candidatus Aenigmarchaeota archaeon]
MICLGIESTAHTFGIGIVSDKGKILSNVWDMYRPASGWGIEPIKAKMHHEEIKNKVLEKALADAKIGLKDIDLIAFSQGAGLAPCLYVGLNFGKELSKRIKKPLIGVCHQIAHVEIGKLCTGVKDPVTLYVSGANTQVLAFAEGRYRCFGETMDVGIGNALDKFGRGVGMDFPSGPKIEVLASKGHYTELPYVVKGMDLSFSGIITESLTRFRKGESLENLCFSLQETMFAMLTEVTERAMAHTGKTELLLTGGVAANSRLQEMLGIMCRERGAVFHTVPKEFAGDCGTNIAWLGILHQKSKMKTKPGILPRQRTDEVDVGWI